MSDLVYIGLGSNLGARESHLRSALDQLPPDVVVTGVSALYETAPVGVTDQPAFLNAVCAGMTPLDPPALLARLKEIERAAGRVPGPDGDHGHSILMSCFMGRACLQPKTW